MKDCWLWAGGLFLSDRLAKTCSKPGIGKFRVSLLWMISASVQFWHVQNLRGICEAAPIDLIMWRLCRFQCAIILHKEGMLSQKRTPFIELFLYMYLYVCLWDSYSYSYSTNCNVWYCTVPRTMVVLLSPFAQAGEEGRQQSEALEKRLAQSQAAAWQKDLTLEPLGSWCNISTRKRVMRMMMMMMMMMMRMRMRMLMMIIIIYS